MGASLVSDEEKNVLVLFLGRIDRREAP